MPATKLLAVLGSLGCAGVVGTGGFLVAGGGFLGSERAVNQHLKSHQEMGSRAQSSHCTSVACDHYSDCAQAGDNSVRTLQCGHKCLKNLNDYLPYLTQEERAKEVDHSKSTIYENYQQCPGKDKETEHHYYKNSGALYKCLSLGDEHRRHHNHQR